MKRPIQNKRGSRKKKSNGLAATEAAATRNRYLRAYGDKKKPAPKIEDIEDMELSECLELLDRAPAKKRRAKKSKASKN